MARKKEFDTEEILDRAIELFWRKGYSNTSVQDLVDYLGIDRGCLYNAFENKHAIFLAALPLYQLQERKADPHIKRRLAKRRRVVKNWKRRSIQHLQCSTTKYELFLNVYYKIKTKGKRQ